MPDALTIEQFSGRVGETFALRDGPASQELVLTSCVALHGHAPERVPFSLIFRGSAETILPQRTYQVDNDGLGPFDLFIVPVGRDQDGTLYEAVFS